MKATKEKRFLSIFFIICISLFIINIPFHYLIKNETIIFILDLFCKIIAIAVILYLNKKDQIKKININKPKLKHLLLLPFLLICITNIFVGVINESYYNNIDYHYLGKQIILCLLVAIIEELLFRELLLSEFRRYSNPFLSIIFSSLIFGGIHILNITTLGSIPQCLLQALYTFLLGLLLGFTYLFTGNIIVPIFFHFLFNYINNSIAIQLFTIDWDITFFIINISISIIMLIYGFILYKIFYKELISNATSIMDI